MIAVGTPRNADGLPDPERGRPNPRPDRDARVQNQTESDASGGRWILVWFIAV